MTHGMQKVDSSQVDAVGYDREKRVLTVKFKSGASYRYFGVSAEKHSSLMRAASIGGFLSAHIKSKHSCEKA